MSATYDPSKLNEQPLYQVRLMLGDTEIDTPLLQDEEITFFLTQNNNNVLNACITACYSIISKLSGEEDFKLGPYSETSKGSVESWQKVLASLKAQGSALSAPMSAAPTTAAIFHYDMMSVECYHD